MRKKDPGFRHQLPANVSPHLLLGAHDQRLGEEQDQLPCRPLGTSSSNFQETETHMVPACNALRLALHNHSSRHLGGWATPRSAEEMLDGQRQRLASISMPELLTMASRKNKKKEVWNNISADSPSCPLRRPIESRN